MNIKIIDNDFNQQRYNEVAIHPLQSWQWGETRKKMGIEVLRIGEFNKGDELKNVFQLTIHQIPPTCYKIGYLPRSIFPPKDIVDYLYDYGKKNNIVFIKIEPYQEISELKTINYKLKTKNLIQSKHSLFPEWTQKLDLTKSEDELLKNMKSKTRYNIRLAERKGVTVKEESNDKSFKIFAKLYFETCQRQKYYGHDFRFHEIVWETLKNNIAHILIAYYNNTPVAVYELFYFNKVFYYPYGGSSDQYKNTMAANLLMWEAIKLGKKLGAYKFDMWGSLPPNYDENNAWSGFTRFKEGYGGNFVQMVGSYDLIINPTLYNIYNSLYKLREFFLNIKRYLP